LARKIGAKNGIHATLNSVSNAVVALKFYNSNHEGKFMKANNVSDGPSLFDITDYLLTGEDVTEYLRQVIADKDAEELVRALKYIDRSAGMAEITKAKGMTSADLLVKLEVKLRRPM
jgi:probable addiction module antidote protein